jgi:hypothetical protein
VIFWLEIDGVLLSATRANVVDVWSRDAFIILPALDLTADRRHIPLDLIDRATGR